MMVSLAAAICEREKQHRRYRPAYQYIASTEKFDRYSRVIPLSTQFDAIRIKGASNTVKLISYGPGADISRHYDLRDLLPHERHARWSTPESNKPTSEEPSRTRVPVQNRKADT